MTVRLPRALVVAVVVAALVATAALVGAAAVRLRAGDHDRAGTATGANPPATGLGPSACLREPCQVLGATTIASTSVELVADAGGTSGRLRIGGPTSDYVIEATITDFGVTLATGSLQCLAGGPSACLIKGRYQGGVAGQLVVGRSDSWTALEKWYLSDAGYLELANVDGDSSPEVLAAQHDCPEGTPVTCATRPVFVEVFGLTGTVAGCTKSYPKVEKLPGYPVVALTKAALTQCATGR